MNEPLYTIEILRLATAIPHLGPLAGPQGQAEVRSPTCGSKVRVEVRLDEHGRVAALGQSVEACAFGQASAAIMGGHAIGRGAGDVEAALGSFTDWLGGHGDHPGNWPGIEALAPARSKTGRHGAMLLPFRALLAAIRAAETRS